MIHECCQNFDFHSGWWGRCSSPARPRASGIGHRPNRRYHRSLHAYMRIVRFVPPLRSIAVLRIPRLATARMFLTRIGRHSHRLWLLCPPKITRHPPGHLSWTPALLRSGIRRTQLTRRPPRPRPAHRPELIVCTVKVRSIVVPVQQRVLRLHPAVLSCAMRCLVRLPSTRKACRPAHGTETASNASSQQLLRGGLDLDGYSAAARQRGFETAMDRYARPRTTRHGGRKKEQLVGARELRILFETVCARVGTEQTF
jgi:hypothetical protein